MIKAIYDLDMTPRKSLPVIINVSQNDDLGRTLVFNLFSSTGTWTAPDSATATLEGGKPDGKFFSFNCTYSKGTVTAIIQQQMTAVAGKVVCKVKVQSGSKVIESAPIYMMVDAAGIPDGADMSKSDVNDAVATATKKIVEQVAGSIPEDYSALSNSVNELKQDIIDLDSFAGIAFEIGFISNKGVEDSRTGFKKTKFIPCYENITITFIALINNAFVNAISYYDKNKDYISGLSNIGTDNNIEYSAITPKGTRFIKVSTTDTLLKNKKWKLSFSESPIVSKMFDDRTSFLSIDYSKMSKKIGKNLFDKNSDKIIVGSFLNSKGKLINNSSFCVSDFIPVEPNTSYYISSTERGGAKDVWYSNDMKTVVGENNSNACTSPPNAAYLRISFMGMFADTAQVEKGESFTGYKEYTENANIMELLDKSMSEFEDNRDIKNYLLWCDIYKGKIYNAYGLLKNDSNYIATSITKLDRTQNLYCGVNGSSYVIFYDANKNFIGRKTFYFGMPVLVKDFPDDAEYVSFALYATSVLADEPYVCTKKYGDFNDETKYFRSTIKKYKGIRPIINVYKSDTEMQIMSKMYDAFLTEDCDVYFEHGTYTFSAIYDKFIEWNLKDAKELIIGGNCKYFFNGSTLIADWDTENTSEMSNASLLGARRKPSSYELHDATLICNGMTYVVHDEATGYTDDYIRRYHNIRMVYNNGDGTSYLSKCLGGGSGLNGVCIFENCTFESNAKLDNPEELSYHGALNNDGEGCFNLTISNCYFKHKIGLHQLGENQKAKCLFNNNSCASVPKSNSVDSVGKWNVISYNNEVHS